jgi:hypothetical protein
MIALLAAASPHHQLSQGELDAISDRCHTPHLPGEAFCEVWVTHESAADRPDRPAGWGDAKASSPRPWSDARAKLQPLTRALVTDWPLRHDITNLRTFGFSRCLVRVAETDKGPSPGWFAARAAADDAL